LSYRVVAVLATSAKVVFVMAILAVPLQDVTHAARCLPLNLTMGNHVRAIPAFTFISDGEINENEKLAK
jgi:hypothetical protein